MRAQLRARAELRRRDVDRRKDAASVAPAKRLRHADRRSQLIAVAERLFIERGYARVSMEDIARVSGVSRPVVYNHFATKERVYIACVQEARAAYELELMRTVDPAAPALEQLRQGGEAFFSMLERDPGRWKLLFGSSSVLPGEHSEELQTLRMRTIRVIHQQMKARVPDAPEPGAEAAAHAVSGIAERLGHWWLTRPDLSRRHMVDLYVRLIWAGIGPYAA